MNKIYLYKITSKKNIGQIYQSFEKYEAKEQKFSFHIESFNKDILEIRSSEKIKSKIKVLSPSGDISYLEYETYQNIIFSIFNHENNLYLALHNPPRSVRSFFNIFSILAGDGYSIEELVFNLGELAEYFTNNYNCSIKFVEIEKVSLNHQSFANVEVYSSSNALKDLEDFIDKNNFNLSKITLNILSLFSESTITFLKKGVIQTNVYDSSLSLSGNEVFKYMKEILHLRKY